jgi:hypothetical protein
MGQTSEAHGRRAPFCGAASLAAAG